MTARRTATCGPCGGWGVVAPQPDSCIWAEVQAERERAHAKHGATSMEAFPPGDLLRLAILLEEVGEVAKVFNDARHRVARLGWAPEDAMQAGELAELRAELIQVAAMAGAWADACIPRETAGEVDL